MIFGFVVSPELMMFGGLLVLSLMIFQVLQGMRKIKFKGRLHLTVHRRTAWVLVALAVLHGLLGIVLTLGLRIGS